MCRSPTGIDTYKRLNVSRSCTIRNTRAQQVLSVRSFEPSENGHHVDLLLERGVSSVPAAGWLPASTSLETSFPGFTASLAGFHDASLEDAGVGGRA